MASRTDANQKAVVAALRAAGYSVLCLHAVGKGCPDLLAARGERTVLLEVKTPGGKLTPAQMEFFDNWRGEVYVVRSVDDALRVVGATAPERA